MDKYVKELNELKYSLNFSDPFMYVFLSLIGVDFDKKNETACIYRINNFLNISINPDYWDTLNDKEKLFIIKHELYHLILKHPTEAFKHFDIKIFGMAADFHINYMLVSDNTISLPKGGLMYDDNDCANLHLTKQLVEEGTVAIYNHLLNYKQECDKLIPDHDWSSFDKNDINIIDGNINNILTNVVKTSGKIPENIKNIIKNINAKYDKNVDYKSVLRKISSNIGFKSFTKRSSLKDHQFFEEADGFRIKYKGTIPIIIDTSGSMMNPSDIEDVCNQLVSIAKQSNLCLKVIECDADVTKDSIWIYNSKKDLTKRMRTGFIGGGGTIVDPAITYINKNINSVKLAIYITDGYVSPPKVSHNYKVIVVLTRNSRITPNDLKKTWGNNYVILKIK